MIILKTILGSNTFSKLIQFAIFGYKCQIFIQMLEKKFSKSYFSSPAHICVNVDSLPFRIWKHKIETDSILL